MRSLLLVSLLVLLLVGHSATAASRHNGLIAFSALVDGVSQVFTVDPDGTGLRQITHDKSGAGQFGLTWSPNGTDLLFTVANAEGRDTLFQSRSDGSRVTQISPPCTHTCLGDDAPDYSPDGTKIVFERAFGPIVKGNASLAAIFTMNADGSDLTQLTQKTTPATAEDHEPQWSPDGTKIAFVRLNPTGLPAHEGAIEVMNPDGSNIRRLTPFAIGASNPHWSPDGTLILFNTYNEPVAGKSANLYTMRADGTHRGALTHYAGGTLQAFADAWSPDGTQIIFRRVRYSGTDTQTGAFYIIDNRGKHLHRLTRTPVTTDSARATWAGRAG